MGFLFSNLILHYCDQPPITYKEADYNNTPQSHILAPEIP